MTRTSKTVMCSCRSCNCFCEAADSFEQFDEAVNEMAAEIARQTEEAFTDPNYLDALSGNTLSDAYCPTMCDLSSSVEYLRDMDSDCLEDAMRYALNGNAAALLCLMQSEAKKAIKEHAERTAILQVEQEIYGDEGHQHA